MGFLLGSFFKISMKFCVLIGWFFFSSQCKWNFIEAPGPWGLGRRPPCKERKSWWRGFIDLFLGVQMVGLATRLVGAQHSLQLYFWASWQREGWVMPPPGQVPSAGSLPGYCSLRECSHPPAVCPPKQTLLVRWDAFIVLALTFSVASLGLSLRVMALLVRVSMKIYFSVFAAWPPSWRERAIMVTFKSFPATSNVWYICLRWLFFSWLWVTFSCSFTCLVSFCLLVQMLQMRHWRDYGFLSSTKSMRFFSW